MEKKKKDFMPIVAIVLLALLIFVLVGAAQKEAEATQSSEEKVSVEGFKELETLPLEELDDEADAYYAMCMAEESNTEVSLYNKFLLAKAELQREEEMVAYFKQLAEKMEDTSDINILIKGHEELVEKKKEIIKELEEALEELENLYKIVEEYDYEL